MADHQHTEAGTSDQTPSIPKAASTIGELFATLSVHITSLVRGEIELTKTKLTAYIQRMGTGAGLLIGAALFGLYLLGWIFHSIELAIAIALPQWAASLIVAGILLLIVIILGLLGAKEVKRAQDTTPNPKAGIDASVDAIKKGMRHE